MNKAKIVQQGDIIHVFCKYNTQFITFVKSFIDDIDKAYNKKEGVFTFHKKHKNKVEEFLSVFYEVEFIEMEIDNSNLLDILDKEDIKNIYRLLAKKYHPDFNKNNLISSDMMKRINIHFEKYLKK